MKILRSLLILLFLLPTFLHAENGIEDRIYKNALNRLEQGKFHLAIELFQQLPDEYLNEFPRALNYSRAWAGGCAFNLSRVIERTQELKLPLFADLLRTGSNQAADYEAQADDCEMASAVLLKYRREQLLLEEQIQLAFLSVITMEKYLKHYADEDRDTLPDDNFDSCDERDLSESSVRTIGGAMLEAKQRLMQLRRYFIGSEVLSNIDHACSLAKRYTGSELCRDGKTENDFTSREVRMLRSLIGESQVIGIGSCGSNEFYQCLCP